MPKYTHNFVETYTGPLAFGLDRATDEATVTCYLQMFSDDRLMEKIINKMSGQELDAVFSKISDLLRAHLTEAEYHELFLRE